MRTRRTPVFLLAAFATACCPARTTSERVEKDPEPAPELKVAEVKHADGTWEEPVSGAPEPVPEAFPPQPPGFGPEDAYLSHDVACLGEVRRVVPAKWRRPILAWCEHRAYHSSRNGTVRSRVDGSQIHDRDRPTAWIFYQQLTAANVLDPEGCPYHRINRKLKHPKTCRKLAHEWPFKDVNLTNRMRLQWMSHPHDMEKFGARGPIDWNANAYRHLPGCWDPAQLERFDVSMNVTVVAALKICKKYGCGSKWDIKKRWGGR